MHVMYVYGESFIDPDTTNENLKRDFTILW